MSNPLLHSWELSEPMERLEQGLLRPLPEVDVAGLQALWQHDDVVLTCRRPRLMEDTPDLPLRLRGVLGNALRRAWEARHDEPSPLLAREDPFDLLFRWRMPDFESVLGRTTLARPFVMRTRMTSHQIEARVRLFGSAMIHGPAIAKALAADLEHVGMSLATRAIRVPVAVEQVRIERFDGAAHRWHPGDAGGALLRLETPVIVRRGQRIRLEPEALLDSALRRAAALAPWMGLQLSADAAALGLSARRLAAQMEIVPARWARTTAAEPGKIKLVEGYTGTVRLEGSLGDWTSLLDLAQYGSLGGECALGMGAIQATFVG